MLGLVRLLLSELINLSMDVWPETCGHLKRRHTDRQSLIMHRKRGKLTGYENVRDL